MSDLVERLRRNAESGDSCQGVSEDMAEAANEIERLRRALRKIADWHGDWGPFPETNNAWRAMVVVTAREAVPAE